MDDDEYFKLRIYTAGWSVQPGREKILDIVDQINRRAGERPMFGELSPSKSMKMSILQASHIVLPTAVLRGTVIVVSVRPTSNEHGELLRSIMRSGLTTQGILRGLCDPVGMTFEVHSVDIDMSPTQDINVLDDIVEAIEAAEGR